MNAEIADRQVALAEVEDAIARAETSVREVETYLQSVGHASEEEIVARDRALGVEIAAVERALASVRSQATVATDDEDAARTALRERELDLESARVRLDEARREAEGLRGLAAQLTLDEGRTFKAMVAGEAFAAFEFTTCPRCLQSVSGRSVDPEHCHLCDQPYNPHSLEVSLQGERDRLWSQLAETAELQRDAEEEVALANEQITAVKNEVDQLRSELDRRTADAVTPFVDEVARLSEQAGTLATQRKLLHRSLERATKMTELRADAEALREERGHLRAALEQARSRQDEARSKISELSDIFDEILQEFQLPWYESASIDPDSYLPVVNGLSFEELSSGGMKVLVSDAYSLAGLSYTLRNRDSYLPSLLIMDSPRKNFGSGPEDSDAAERIYRRLRRISDTYRGDAFQLIVADNDVPSMGSEFSRVSLDYDKPLIDDLQHPGPAHVQTIGSED